MQHIGILALQGDFARHQETIHKCGPKTIFVKTPEHLRKCSGLIIPGGESTTLVKLMKKHNLWQPLIEFGKSHPIFGTCAGCIVLAKHIAADLEDSLGLIDIQIKRNAYGRQIDSFIDDVHVELDGEHIHFNAFFIRAPKIEKIGPQVTVLAQHNDAIVLAEQGNILVATFHPELTDDTRIHQYFLKKINGK